MTHFHLFCKHSLCEITHWPGAPLGNLLERLGTAGLVTTAMMRSHLAGGTRRVRYPREMLAEVSPTPAWDHLDETDRTRVANSLQARLTPIAADPLNAARHLMAGQAWLKLDDLDELINDIEIHAGGASLPPIADRLRSAGIEHIYVFEPYHRHSDTTLWKAALDAGIAVRLVIDPGLDRSARHEGELPRHDFVGDLEISTTVHAALAASPARHDGPPPQQVGPLGCVELHQVTGANAGDLPWVTAGLLAGAGIPATTRDLPHVPTNLTTDNRVILVVVPSKADVLDMADRLGRHLVEPVVQFRTRHDAHAIETCTRILRGLLDNDATPLRDALLHRVGLVTPTAVGAARNLLRDIDTTGVADWIRLSAQRLASTPLLRPLSLVLTRLESAVSASPHQLLHALSLLVDIDALRRPNATGDGVSHLSPTIERAAGAATLRDALTVMDRSGWSPSRPTSFEPGRPRILVAAVNEITGVVVDVVVLVRPKTRGFPGSDCLPASSSEIAQRVLYGCLASARESVVLLHRGRNDLMPWAIGVAGVASQVHHLSGI